MCVHVRRPLPARLHQLIVSAVYADEGVSGVLPLPSRPAGARILPDARLHRFDQLLVYKLDRLGRETRLTLEAAAELEMCGVRVKSLTGDFDTATVGGRNHPPDFLDGGRGTADLPEDCRLPE